MIRTSAILTFLHYVSVISGPQAYLSVNITVKILCTYCITYRIPLTYLTKIKMRYAQPIVTLFGRNKDNNHILTMETFPGFSSHEYNVTTSKEHWLRQILFRLASKKENSFATQTERKANIIQAPTQLFSSFNQNLYALQSYSNDKKQNKPKFIYTCTELYDTSC